MLQNDPQKVPAPDWNEMMRLLVNSNEDIIIAQMVQMLTWSVTKYVEILLVN